MVVIQVANWIMMLASSGFIFFISAFFFLGSYEDHQVLKEDLLTSFLIRFGFAYIMVLIGALTIYLGNVLILRLRPRINGMGYAKDVGFRTLILLTLADLVGTCIFFF